MNIGRNGPWPDDVPSRGPSDLELTLTLRLGSTQLPLTEIVELTQGQVLELDRFVDDPVDLLLNGQLVARGEVVVESEGPVVVITDVVE